MKTVVAPNVHQTSWHKALKSDFTHVILGPGGGVAASAGGPRPSSLQPLPLTPLGNPKVFPGQSRATIPRVWPNAEYTMPDFLSGKITVLLTHINWSGVMRSTTRVHTVRLDSQRAWPRTAETGLKVLSAVDTHGSSRWSFWTVITGDRYVSWVFKMPKKLINFTKRSS